MAQPCALTLTRTRTLALTLTLPFLSFILGPCFALGQNMVSPQIRGVASAVLTLSASGVGLMVGPWVTGYISDLLMPTVGAMRSLQLSLTLVCCVLPLLSAVCFCGMSGSIHGDLKLPCAALGPGANYHVATFRATLPLKDLLL
jgi:MFS family permease